MVQGALRMLQSDGKFAGGAPENSAVGESQSNSRAERAVLEAEIRIRILKHALQERINRRLPSIHPVMHWLVQYAGVLITKYAVHEGNATSYPQIHGKRATERLCEFGERILALFPNDAVLSLILFGHPGFSWAPRSHPTNVGSPQALATSHVPRASFDSERTDVGTCNGSKELLGRQCTQTLSMNRWMPRRLWNLTRGPI